MGKETQGLESIPEQLNPLDRFSIQNQTMLLNDTLDYLLEYENKNIDPIDETLNAYLQGDLNQIRDLVLTDFDENNPLDVKLKKLLLTDRNYRMKDRIIENITANPDKQFFFAIGAGHFYGEEGIINLLENEGYNATKVPFEECENCKPDEIKINNRCYMAYEP